jgi:hypothetical protein
VPRNFIAEAQEIATELDVCSEGALATALRDAIDNAATGSEILTGLRFHLRKVQDVAAADEALKQRADELAQAINAVLLK